VNAPCTPLVVLAGDVFRDKPEAGFATDEGIQVDVRRGERKADVRAAVRRRDFDKAVAIGKRMVKDQRESELLRVETKATVKVADVHNPEM